jgi:hypothetical protein
VRLSFLVQEAKSEGSAHSASPVMVEVLFLLAFEICATRRTSLIHSVYFAFQIATFLHRATR